MDAPATLAGALAEAGIEDRLASVRHLSGGCIHQVMALRLESGDELVAKVNRAALLTLFEEESHSLAALAATRTVIVPEPLALVIVGDHAVLLMTAIQPPSLPSTMADAWGTFGRDLAALHACDAGARYGFDHDNHVGSSVQPNAWGDDWVEFNRVNRLGHQVRLARQAGHLSRNDQATIERVIENLDQFIPRQPRPSLLHGDLWSGNALPSRDRAGSGATFAVIDPACSIGDGLADIAMMRLFGGFDAACFESYEAAASVKLDAAEARGRIAVYQLYHVLNHVNIFGRSYLGQALDLAASLRA